MKLARLTLAFVAACYAQASSPPPGAPPRAVGEVMRIDEELTARLVAPDAYVVTESAFVAANVLVVRMPDGTVVICSSPYETESARSLVKWIRAALAPARIVAINTHFHFDGTGGNEAFRELGVETYASTHTQELLRERGETMRAAAVKDFDDAARKRRVEAMRVVLAERTFPEQQGLALAFGGEEVRVRYPGPAHSPDNVLVFFPSRGVLFGGCMVKGSRSVGYIGDADLDHWEAAVDDARGLGARVVVPGHGGVSSTDLFDVTTAVVRDARAKR